MEQELRGGGPGVDVGGIRLQVTGFSGVVHERGAGEAAPGGAERGEGPASRLSDRLIGHLQSAPGEAFRVGPPIEVAGQPEVDRDRATAEPSATATVPREPHRLPLLLAEDDDGFLSWQLPDNHDALLASGGAGERGGAPADAVFTIAMSPGASASDGERGISSFLFKKVFRVVSALLFDPLAAKVGKQLATWKERSRQPLLRWFGPEDFHLPVSAGLGDADLAAAASGRALLFVHGTNSLSHSGFGRLPKEFLASLWQAYGGRVLGFDHPTLSVSPTDNAAWLATWLGQHLPDGRCLEVDIVAHSRGGLVARELAERADEHGLTATLRVSSVTFVGTPNKGTPLCEPVHLAAYVDTLTNLLSVIPDNGITDALDGVVGMVSHLASKAYGGIPGAMAMDPAGTYLHRLNPGGPPDGCTYRGIASGFEPEAGAGWKRRLRDLVIDKVFRNEENDLLVPTASVWGDELVPESQRWRLGAEEGVDHSSYWQNPGTVERMRTWLEGALAVPAPANPVTTAPVMSTTSASASVAVTADAPPPASVASAPSRAMGAPAPAVADLEGAIAGGGRWPTLDVEAVHGSLEHALWPVVVGHHSGAMTEGAEGYLDRRMGGVISRRQFLRLYPEEPGDVLQLQPGPDPRPPGAFVVCLGQPNEVTSSTIVRCALRAALGRLVSVLDDCRAGRRPATEGELHIGLSTVLMGSGGPTGVAIPIVVQSLIEGVLRANREIQSQLRATPGILPAITHLELLEVQEDRAEIAARALDRIGPTLRHLNAPANDDEHPAVRCATELRMGEGGRPAAPPQDQRSVAWRSLSIGGNEGATADDGLTDLRFTLFGDLAGVPNMEHSVDVSLVAPLLERASRRSDPDDQVHNTLFELLLPSPLKAALATGGNLTLVLEPSVANYPWEMLAMRLDAATARPLCVERGLLRQLDLAQKRTRQIKRATTTNALVIGNPPATPAFQPLAGAKEEAVAVADLLAKHDYRVTRLIFDEQGRPVPGGTGDPLQGVPPERYWEVILDELYRREYRIVHLAAHGIYDKTRPSRSGAVIGPSRFLSALAFESLRAMPELVFFNCCHLGRVDEPAPEAPVYGQVASSVAEVLMTSGIRAVVAAGWAVNDLDAVEFATELYGALLNGVAFGEATRDARTRIYVGPGRDSTSPNPRSSTWGAYQCYGEPGFRLTVGVRERFDASNPTLVLRADVERQLTEIAAEAGDVRSREERAAVRERLSQRLHDIISTTSDGIPALKYKSWATPLTWAKLGAAQAELGDFAGAIASLQQALDGPNSKYPVDTVERLANLMVRQAQKLRRAGLDHARAEELFAEAKRLLDALLSIRPTAERLALKASYHKKRAASLFDRRCSADPSADQRAGVVDARDAYRQAAARGNNKYYVLNDVQLSHLLDEVELDEAQRRVEAAFASTGRDDRVQAEFTRYWERVAAADRLLSTRLLEGGLADAATELHDAYDSVFGERSTWKERDSTVDHLWDLSRLHPDAAQADALEELWRVLREDWQGDQ
jgi:hypothetical protein